MTTVGSLCTGYDGLGLVTKALWPDAETVFVSDVDRHVNEWLEARLPDVPNVGDFTQLDRLPACDVLTAGFPCQPASTAGQRKGIDDDRWLWPAIERTIRNMDRPPAVVLLENVPGLLTVNGGDAMADVVGGLASLGYVGSYGIVGARDVGACHRRDRLWIVAALDPGHATGSSQHRIESGSWPIGTWEPGAVTAADSDRGGSRVEQDARRVGRLDRVDAGAAWERERSREEPVDRSATDLLPTPGAANANYDTTLTLSGDGRSRPNKLGWAVATLLPTPTSRDHKGRNQRDDTTCLPGAVHHNLLPTPTASEAKGGETPGKRPSGHNKQASVGGSLATLPSPNESFGQYAPAVERWATTIGRPAPEPTVDGRLNPVFVEWMMGLPEGWVTGDDVALSRTAQLRMLGNGVVPQVAVAAYSQLLDRLMAVAA